MTFRVFPPFVAWILLVTTARPAADFIWVEGEAPAKSTIEAPGVPWNKPDALSNGKALVISIEADEVAKKVPASGLEISYDLPAPSAGVYELWNRIGFESLRPEYEWRINGGEWRKATLRDNPTIDVIETAFWNPLGWSRLGEAELKSGKNTLEIRIFPERKGDKQEVQPIRYVSDVLCAYKGAWTPNHHHPPGEAWMTAADREAGTQVFTFPRDETGTARDVVKLDGLWQYAAWDEAGEITEETRARGVDQLPDPGSLHWHGIEVPGDRNARLPQFLYNHRYLLRTRVDVPSDLRGSSFVLDLREISLIATLFVNGRRVGDFATVYGFWKPDITRYIEPGKINEIVLVFKDAFYAMRPDDKGVSMRSSFYLPLSIFQRNQGTTMRFDFPVNGAEETGILEGARLVATGPVRVDDAFVRTLVQEKQIQADLTLVNSGSSAASVEVTAAIHPWPEGPAVKTLPAVAATIGAGQTATVKLADALAGLQLWWPDDPQLYQLITTVRSGGKTIDTQTTRFGVREWQVKENQFFLNGIRWQLRADLSGFDGPRGDGSQKSAKEFWDRAGLTMFRLRFQYNWGGMRYGQTLSWMDEIGMPVRLAASSFDGQMAAYNLRDNPRLFDRWREQMRNRIAEWRNHPSVFVWELDNEIIYINARNLGNLDIAEPEFTKAAVELAALDPTRSVVSGGGNALRDQSLPTYGIHYFEVDDREYPNEAYSLEQSLAAQNRGDNWHPWPVDFDKKPIFMSETAFLPGRNAAGFAAVGGEATFLGKTEAKPAAGLIARWLTEGYRWKGVSAFHHWFDDTFTGNSHFSSFQPVAVFCREWNWTFGGGQKVSRTLKVFNETRFEDPVEATWQFSVDGRVVAEGKKSFALAAGSSAEWPVSFAVPVVKDRTSAEFVVTASRGGKEVFREVKPSAVIDPAAGPRPANAGLIVWDPQGSVTRRLQDRGIAFKPVKSFAEVPDQFGTLIVGRDAITANESTDARWKALAAAGRKILVLEQNEPLHFQAVPANFEVAPFGAGRIAFIQEFDHPVFEGLKDPDFFTWSGDGIVYKKPYRKASAGARSLAHCDENLAFSMISACPVNDGLMLLSQAVVGEKLDTDPVAQRLFDNMLSYVSRYQPVRKAAGVVADAASPTGRMLAGMGMTFESATDPVQLLREGKAEVVVVQATAGNLKKLAEAPEVVKAFTNKGGWIMIMGVSPETLADFNRIVGYDHILRPFRQEKVQFAAVRDPLTAGLGLQDVVMSSGRRIQDFNRDEWPVDDGFQAIVDLDDIAPFCKFPDPGYFHNPATTGPGDDTWPLNMVNGYLSDSNWRMIFSIHLKDGDPTNWDIELPREEEITGFSIVPNGNYHEITKIRLTFDGKPETAQDFDLRGVDRQDLAVNPVKARKINIELVKWNPKGSIDVIGVDNLWVRVKRPEGFADRVKPMLNIGGLVKYPMGAGGIILNQYNIIDNEQNPVNSQKKQIVTATILRNLGAAFAGGKTIVAGQGLTYSPVALDNFCNLYLRSDRGFPVRDNDLSALPVGRQRFGGVDYQIRDFATSPLESGILLQRDDYKVETSKMEVKEIPIEKKADALFFLHTLLPGETWQRRDGNAQEPIVFKYVARYEDGTAAEIPVELGLGVASWMQSDPRSLRDAAAVWQVPAAAGGKKVVVYQMQWTNPRPDKKIKSLDIVYGPEGNKWGAPVVLGITAAEARK